MSDFFSHFHLLRPQWLLAFIPALLLFVFLLKRRLTSARWQGIIDPNLMPHVLDQMPTEQSRWPLWFVLLAWLIACIALAGPTWQQLPQPVQKKDDSLVIILDMSLSMAAQDVSPDRATRAQQKVIDILKQRNEGLTAMVVYAGDAYTVTPLTDDADTVINLVPALSPFIMPAMGSRPDKALLLAKKLITDAGLVKANYLLITDGIVKKDILRIKKALGKQAKQLSVLTIGTEEGAPIAMQGQGFKRDKNGNIILPKLDLDLISELASELGISWHQMSFDDRDWHYLLQNTLNQNVVQNEKANSFSTASQDPLERQFDLWADQGYWLIFILIVFASFYFRRGWMLSLTLVAFLQTETSFAQEQDMAEQGLAEQGFWQNLWTTKDQQGQAVFQQDPKQAAELFEDANWKASSHYRAGDYQAAADNYTANPDDSEQEQANSHYNRGNALAHAGDLEQAIKAYQQALEVTPDFEDASFNKHLVEELLKQQQSDSKQENSDQENSEQQDSQQQDSQQQNSEDKQSQEQDSQQNESQNQDSDQQQSEEKNSEEQDSEEQQSEEQESEKEQSAQQASQDESEQEKSTDQQASQPVEDELSREEKQALKQWLNRIPDDPGGLLKRKFLYQYKQREHQDEGEVSW
jgi:Ca-activated chloride channel family protein